MSLDTSAVRQKLVDVIGAISPTVTTYHTPPHHPTPPCLLVYPPDTIDYKHLRGTDRAVYPILALVAPQDPTAIETLEALMGSQGDLSIRAALYANRTLDGTISNLRLLDMTSGAYQIGVGPEDLAIGAEFRVEILA